jgi:sugar transferase (PEP-CTERM/EpsH1 system associated)
VHLACFADEPVAEGAVSELRRHCERLAVVPLGAARWLRAAGCWLAGRSASEGAFRSPAMHATLTDWARRTRYSAAMASSSAVAGYLRLPELRDVPAVVDMVDVDSQKWFDYAAACRGPRSWLYRTEGARVRRLESDLSHWARAVTLVSEAEVRLYRRSCQTGARAGTARALPNGVDVDYFRPERQAAVARPPSCVFIGALDYPPNVDAACWFTRHVWPHLRQRLPSSTFDVVGRRPVRAVRRLARIPGVNVVGRVPDVRPYLARATVALAPLRIARGVQNKVLEAMAMGKAVICSPQALAGLDAEPGVHVLTASAVHEWVDAVVRLCDDESLRRQLGSAARDYVADNHCWDQCLQPIGAALGLTTDVVLEGVACERG